MGTDKTTKFDRASAVVVGVTVWVIVWVLVTTGLTGAIKLLQYVVGL